MQFFLLLFIYSIYIIIYKKKNEKKERITNKLSIYNTTNKMKEKVNDKKLFLSRCYIHTFGDISHVFLIIIR